MSLRPDGGPATSAAQAGRRTVGQRRFNPGRDVISKKDIIASDKRRECRRVCYGCGECECRHKCKAPDLR